MRINGIPAVLLKPGTVDDAPASPAAQAVVRQPPPAPAGMQCTQPSTLSMHVLLAIDHIRAR